MKYIFCLLFFFLSLTVFSQSPFNRSGPSVTAIDARVRTSLTFGIPIVADTSLAGGLDSLGSLCYSKTQRSFYIRDSSLPGGHKWTKVILSGQEANLATASLNATGNYDQNWRGFQLEIDSIGDLGVASKIALTAPYSRWSGLGAASTAFLLSSSVVDNTGPTAKKSSSVLMGEDQGREGIVLTSSDSTGRQVKIIITTEDTARVEINELLLVRNRGIYTDTLTATTMGNGDSSNRVASTAFTKRLLSLLPASGITQLTTDVTAGPGTGSQVATIAANAVTNAKFRQSVGVSVVGRSTNSTGNVADIVSALASTYMKRAATTVLFDSIDFAELKNIPTLNQGVYFSPAQNLNPGFIVFASAIVRPTNAFSNGVPILYEILEHTSGHNSSFFDSAYGNTSSGRLFVRYPTVRYVLNGTVTPDEIFAQYCTTPGPSVGFFDLQFPAYHPISVGFKLTGNGSGTWTVAAAFPSLISASTYNTTTGLTGFNLTAFWGIDYNSVQIQYIGPNNYHIKRQYSALGIYNVGFNLIDQFGNVVTTNPTTSDEIVITNSGTHTAQIHLGTWLTNINQFMSTASNFWIFGAFECWMVAAPVSTTSIQVRWQTDYPSATTYKILRSSTGINGTFTLVHTGTSGSFIDTGLTPNTLYNYKMQAVVGGIDVNVTTFNANTKF